VFDLPTWDRVFLVTSIFCIITNLIKRKTQRHKAPLISWGRKKYKKTRLSCLETWMSLVHTLIYTSNNSLIESHKYFQKAAVWDRLDAWDEFPNNPPWLYFSYFVILENVSQKMTTLCNILNHNTSCDSI
jgi:hypothetical protein